MRVLFLSTWFPFPLSQGSKIRAYHLIRAIARDHETALISFADTKLDPSWSDHLQKFCSQVKVVQRNPFTTSRLGDIMGWLSSQPSFVRASYSHEMAALTREFISNWGPDRIVAFTFVMGPYALEVHNIPRMIDVDNYMSRMMYESYQSAERIIAKARRYIAWRKFINYEKWLYHQFSGCLVTTDRDRRLMSDQLGLHVERVHVIPNGVDTSYNFPTDDHPDSNSLVFNGSLMYQANYDAMNYFLREIFPAVFRENPSVCLTITGRFEGVAVDKLLNTDRVKFTGYLDDIRPVIRRSWACIVPLRMGGGTRLKILESMALGTPVVSTSKGAEGLDVIPGIHLLIADDPEEFAAQTVRLINDSQLRRSLSANAIRFVKENYEWETIGERFSIVLDQLRT
jgi:glycosyltransferase involved in cell wall biosynthesis